MQYNECKVCGANNGRAGMLIGNSEKGWDFACLNCHDTRESGNLVIHANLTRTSEELAKTAAQLDPKPSPQSNVAPIEDEQQIEPTGAPLPRKMPFLKGSKTQSMRIKMLAR